MTMKNVVALGMVGCCALALYLGYWIPAVILGLLASHMVKGLQ